MKPFMKVILSSVCVVALVMSMSNVLGAAENEDQEPKQEKVKLITITGLIDSIDAGQNSLKIKVQEKDETTGDKQEALKTIKFNAETSIKLGKNKAEASELQKGQRVTVRCDAVKLMAASIKAKSAKEKKEKKVKKEKVEDADNDEQDMP